jgi:uncharacterized membrane protein
MKNIDTEKCLYVTYFTMHEMSFNFRSNVTQTNKFDSINLDDFTLNEFRFKAITKFTKYGAKPKAANVGTAKYKNLKSFDVYIHSLRKQLTYKSSKSLS